MMTTMRESSPLFCQNPLTLALEKRRYFEMNVKIVKLKSCLKYFNHQTVYRNECVHSSKGMALAQKTEEKRSEYA